jgi:hypothetical protein
MRQRAPQCQVSCREASNPFTRSLSCGVAHPLVMRNAASILIAGGAVPMKHSDPKRAKRLPIFGFTVFASSRLWLSEASLRAVAQRGVWDRFLTGT